MWGFCPFLFRSFFPFLGGTTLCGTSFPIKRQNFAANKIKEDDKENGRMTLPEEEQDDDVKRGGWEWEWVALGFGWSQIVCCQCEVYEKD